MRELSPTDRYTTPKRPLTCLTRRVPGLVFYTRMINVIFRCAWLGKRRRLKGAPYARQSWRLLRAMEAAGGRFDIQGLDVLRRIEGPAVYVGNHMSSLETFVIPAIIRPFHDMTFVVKESLTRYPVFKHVMNGQDPIVVGRVNPREDLKTILEEGLRNLAQGVSVVVFPQTTRTLVFDPAQFNSIGVKLALKAGVPVVPIALTTDAWGNGKRLKDFGKIDPSRPIRFAIGEPIMPTGNGREAQQQAVDFIQGHFDNWMGHARRD